MISSPILIAVTGLVLSVFGRDVTAEPQVLSYQGLLDEIVAEPDTIYSLSDAIIRLDPVSDQRFMVHEGSNLTLHTARRDTIVIDKYVYLTKPPGRITGSRAQSSDRAWPGRPRAGAPAGRHLYRDRDQRPAARAARKRPWGILPGKMGKGSAARYVRQTWVSR